MHPCLSSSTTSNPKTQVYSSKPNKNTFKKLLEKKNPIKKYKNLGSLSLKKIVKIEFPKEQKIQTTLKKISKNETTKN
jgi:hypothetical protein